MVSQHVNMKMDHSANISILKWNTSTGILFLSGAIKETFLKKLSNTLEIDKKVQECLFLIFLSV